VVLNPSQPDLEYDLVAQIGNENFKIQVKTGKRKDDKVLVADIRKSARPRNPYKKLHYTKDDVDIFAITDPETRRVAYY
ncbi:group I intron-associated PD-(D/E)XK endonuclease, partial [Campylobacter fetus subsp. venerealis]